MPVMLSRGDIAALASRMEGHVRRWSLDRHSERADIGRAAKVLRALIALGVPVLPIEIDDADDGDK